MMARGVKVSKPAVPRATSREAEMDGAIAGVTTTTNKETDDSVGSGKVDGNDDMGNIDWEDEMGTNVSGCLLS